MNCIRSRGLAAIAAYVVGCVLMMQSGSAAAGAGNDAARLARAWRDVMEAEQALRANPAAAAVFGPMLREAKTRLDAGLAASVQTTRDLDVLHPPVEARASQSAHDDVLQSLTTEHGRCAFPTNAAEPASKPVTDAAAQESADGSTGGSAGRGLPPRRRPPIKLLIWV